jgi:hypothetical protein
MMSPASYSPFNTADSIAENNSSVVFRACGNARPRRKLAVV